MMLHCFRCGPILWTKMLRMKKKREWTVHTRESKLLRKHDQQPIQILNTLNN